MVNTAKYLADKEAHNSLRETEQSKKKQSAILYKFFIFQDKWEMGETIY